jgi:membrane protein DedA with SNARE-associated domain
MDRRSVRISAHYGSYIGLTETRIKIAQYLFRRQGMVVVLIARFVAVLRSVVGFIAGANRIISAKVSRNLRDPSRWRLP